MSPRRTPGIAAPDAVGGAALLIGWRRGRLVLADARDRQRGAAVTRRRPWRRGNLTLTVTANGTLQPTRSIAIGSELSGTVLKVNVDVNDRIKKGQVLVELDTSKLHDQILRSRASLPPQRQGRADRRHGEGSQGHPRPVRRGGAPVRRQGAVQDRTRQRARHARARAGRRNQRARQRHRRAGRAVHRRDQPVESVDPRAVGRRDADAQRRSRQRGRRVAAGGDAVHRRRRPEQAAPAGLRRRGRRRRR